MYVKTNMPDSEEQSIDEAVQVLTHLKDFSAEACKMAWENFNKVAPHAIPAMRGMVGMGLPTSEIYESVWKRFSPDLRKEQKILYMTILAIEYVVRKQHDLNATN